MSGQIRLLWSALGLAALATRPGVVQAQMHAHPVPADSTAQKGMYGMDMSGMDMGEMPMNGMYGPYAMSREASGTAWQPEAARHEGIHVMRGDWMAMLHGFADLVYDNQGGHRGDAAGSSATTC